MEWKNKKILLVRHPLEGHDRGFWIIVRALRDGGFEVIPASMVADEIVNTVIEEDIGFIGYRIMTGAPLLLVKLLSQKLQEKGVTVPIVVGGIIPDDEVPALKEMGVVATMGPGTPLSSLVNFFKIYPAEES